MQLCLFLFPSTFSNKVVRLLASLTILCLCLSAVEQDNRVWGCSAESVVRCHARQWHCGFCLWNQHPSSWVRLSWINTHLQTQVQCDLKDLRINYFPELWKLMVSFQWAVGRTFYGLDAERERRTHAVVPGWAPAYGQRSGPPTAACLQHQQWPTLSQGEPVHT